VPIGVQNAPPAWQEAARRAGLAVLAAGGAVSAGRAPPRAGVSAAPPRGPGLVVAEPVRGGQQIHGPDGDVTVLGPVGHGAEIAAAGHIHVYGSLRGRAFAGINGDQGAMIFCDQLEAELLSIAGLYLVNEDIDPRFLGRRVRVHCEADRLVLAALG
jgi:septum site-determining protein MinC